MIKSILFALLLLFAVGFFLNSIIKIIGYLKIGKPENRLNNIPVRLVNTLKIALLQSKLFRRRFAGLLHSFIFWGFAALVIIIVESFIEGFIPNFSFRFLGRFYSVITFTQDIFGALVFFTVLVSLIRRFVGTPDRLKVDRSSKGDAVFILVMIMLVMITMMGANAERILLGQSHGFRPVSSLVAGIIGSGSDLAYEFFWWAHNIVVLFFLNYLPFSKHFHVLSSVPNTFLSNFGIDKKNTLKTINFEDETIQQYGAKDIEDLSWKQLLDGYTCTECGRCTEVCPANSTGKLLNPKKIITQIRRRTMDKGPIVAKGTGESEVLERTLVHDYISQDELWACTTCAACVEECPVMIDHVTSIVDMRRNLAMMESAFPNEVGTVFRNLENNESPWAFGPEQRNEWIEEFIEETEKSGKDLSLRKLSETGTADGLDVVFWVGCAGAFDQRYRSVTKAFAKIMNTAGVKFGVLGSEEKCNGDTARRLGNEFLAQQFIMQNIETFKRYGVKKIVTACPHCLHSLKNEYGGFGIELDVVHHTQFIGKLVSEGKIKPEKKPNGKYTYHDSCYLGRYNGVYGEPRELVRSASGQEVIEMERSKDRGFCCGAGGGRMFMEETEGKRVNIERTEEALKTGAGTVATACPFCMTMLSDGVKAKEAQMKVRDVAEIIADGL